MENDEYGIMYLHEQSYWWFVGKQFLIRDNLKRLGLAGLKRARILDVGCGTGIILELLGWFGTACGIELSPQAIRYLRKRDLRSVARCDVNQSIPFKDDVFSAVTCLDVLEHLDDDLILMKEIVRVCRPGGYIFITVPAFAKLWSPHDVALHHKRRYTRKQMLENVRGLQCEIIKASYYNSLLFIPILAVRKFRSFLSEKNQVQSDLSIILPVWLNKVLALFFVAEIYCLRFFNFPFGVSFLLILKKLKVSQTDSESR